MWVDVDAGQCCRLDAERGVSVGSEVISHMSSRLEAPAEPWETHLRLTHPVLQGVDQCAAFILSQRLHPLSPLVDDSKERVSASSKSAIHLHIHARAYRQERAHICTAHSLAPSPLHSLTPSLALARIHARTIVVHLLCNRKRIDRKRQLASCTKPTSRCEK